MSMNQDLIKRVAAHVNTYMSQFDGSHDFHHIKRVLGLSHQIYQAQLDSDPRLNLDLTVITLSALLHDVGDRKYLLPGQDSETLVYNLLSNFGADKGLAQKVQKICSAVSYTNEMEDPQATKDLIVDFPELAVVQDADRLDAIGAVGVGRLFTYGGAKTGREMEVTMGFMKGEGKLLKLEGMMKTEEGRKLAKERTERLLVFRRWWDEETAAEKIAEGLNLI